MARPARLLTVAEAAQYLQPKLPGVNTGYLLSEHRRTDRIRTTEGPAVHRKGSRLYYTRSELDAFVERVQASRCRPTEATTPSIPSKKTVGSVPTASVVVLDGVPLVILKPAGGVIVRLTPDAAQRMAADLAEAAANANKRKAA